MVRSPQIFKVCLVLCIKSWLFKKWLRWRRRSEDFTTCWFTGFSVILTRTRSQVPYQQLLLIQSQLCNNQTTKSLSSPYLSRWTEDSKTYSCVGSLYIVSSIVFLQKKSFLFQLQLSFAVVKMSISSCLHVQYSPRMYEWAYYIALPLTIHPPHQKPRWRVRWWQQKEKWTGWF